MKLTSKEIEKAKDLISKRLNAAGSRFPVPPLRPEDAELVSRYLQSKKENTGADSLNYEKMSNKQLIAELKRRDAEASKEKKPLNGTFRANFEIGILYANQVVSEIRKLAFMMGLEYEIEIDHQMLTKSVRVKVRGKADKLESFQLSYNKYMRQLDRVLNS